jgi:hypothetical protein
MDKIDVEQVKTPLDFLMDHAIRELDIAGIKEDESEPSDSKGNTWMRRHLLSVVQEFKDADHSRSSITAALDILNVLLTLRPLTPLNGTPDEWQERDLFFADGLRFLNKRCPTVYKTSDGRIVDVEGKIFWEWIDDGKGSKVRSFYRTKESWVDITFPYVPNTEYVEKESEESKISKMPFTEFKDKE